MVSLFLQCEDKLQNLSHARWICATELYCSSVLFLSGLEVNMQRVKAKQMLKVNRMLTGEDAALGAINIRL